MITFKCKMCGGDLRPEENATTCECEYCGSMQTIPTADNEKKGNLFNRANRLRMAAEYDKAAAVYTSITAEFPEEAEAYWGLCLCKYGIEYVEDPVTAKKIPTCHRTRSDSIMDDPDFDQACENADAVAKRVYREEAKAIDRLQRDILSVVANESPYDVFICYKETDDNGERTEDSVLAQDIYDALTAKGLKVFFARITLEDKLGQQYEPYIYAALHSAKVMLSIGTQYEYFDAVWVKNEWARFLDMMKTDKSKTFIPCYKGIDAYDMPREFKNLQAQDMGKLGWLQDLTRGVLKLCGKDTVYYTIANDEQVMPFSTANVTALLKRTRMFLREESWEKADQYIDRILDADPENSEVYLLRILEKYHCPDEKALCEGLYDIGKDFDLEYAIEFANAAQKQHLDDIVSQLDLRLRRHSLVVLLNREIKRRKGIIKQVRDFKQALTFDSCKKMLKLIDQLPDNPDRHEAVGYGLDQAFALGASVFPEQIRDMCNLLPEGDKRRYYEQRLDELLHNKRMETIFLEIDRMQDISDIDDVKKKIGQMPAQAEKEEALTYFRERFGKLEEARRQREELERLNKERKAKEEAQLAIAQRERKEKEKRLMDERDRLRTELANLRGLFTGKRRKEIERQLASIDSELSRLNGI